jgi:hypothetical protein
MSSHLSIFTLVSCAFGVSSKKILPILMGSIFSVFSSNSFRSLVCFVFFKIRLVLRVCVCFVFLYSTHSTGREVIFHSIFDLHFSKF